MQELRTFATVIDLLAMATSLWLGFYIVTRSFSSLLSWLATLILWALAIYFFINALLDNVPGNLYFSWLQQMAILELPLMLHLSFLLMPPRGLRRFRRLTQINWFAVPVVYALGAAFILAGVLPANPPAGLFNSHVITPPSPGEIAGYPGRHPSQLYPLFVVYLALVSGLALSNLWLARKEAKRTALMQPFGLLFVAVAIGGAGALYGGFATWFQLDLPTWPADLLMGSGTALIGVAVARYSALLEGRPLERDFVYTLIAVGALTAFYTIIVLILFLGDHVSFLTLVLTIAGAVAANSIFDALRLTLDRFFYQRQFRLLRTNLRDLAREAGTAQGLAKRLQSIVDALCRVVQIRHAFIALSEGDNYIVQATHDSKPVGTSLPAAALSGNDMVGLVHPEKRGLAGMKLLVPLAAGGVQVGTCVLGGKETRMDFSEDELDLIQDLGDQIAALISGVRRQEEDARKLNAMVENYRERERALQLQVQEMLTTAPPEAPAQATDEEFVRRVEDALRHYHDLAYLGEEGLLLGSASDMGATTLDRGKAVADLLGKALDKLRPTGAEPDKRQVAPREWHPYLILHDSYVMDEPNRDIMGRLYISEGTFNRTRRKALAAVARAVSELAQGKGMQRKQAG